jgi:copper chaperone
MNRLSLEIRGMSCGHCLHAVSNTLNKLEGVKVDQVKIGAATLEYDPARVSPDAINEAIADQGYQVVGTHQG